MQQLTIEQNKLMGISCRVVTVAIHYTTDARAFAYILYIQLCDKSISRLRPHAKLNGCSLLMFEKHSFIINRIISTKHSVFKDEVGSITEVEENINSAKCVDILDNNLCQSF
jgi:hypothetical protein